MKRSPILMLAGPTLLIAVIALGVLWSRSANPLPMRDFPEYWSAGSAFLNGKNPYDPPVLLELQRQATNDPAMELPLMMWNPPWAFPLVGPLGLLAAPTAQIVWLIVQIAAVLISVAMLLKAYRMPKGAGLVGFSAALLFAPFFLLVWYGQIGGFCLLGLAGLIYFHDRGMPLSAGAFASLTALKPHLLFAVGLMLLLDAMISHRGRRTLLGGGLALAFAAFVAWAINPMVYAYYIESIRAPSSTMHVSVRDWKLPLISYWLRIAVDPQKFWLQFMPTLGVAVVIIALWLRSRKPVNWPVQTPRLVLVSVIACAYGAWMFDLVVLLVPVLQATVWLVKSYPQRRTAVMALAVAYILLNLGCSVGPALAMSLFNQGVGLQEFLFFSPTILLLYLAAGAISSRTPSE